MFACAIMTFLLHSHCVVQAYSTTMPKTPCAPASSSAANETDPPISFDQWASTSDNKESQLNADDSFPNTDFEYTTSKFLQPPDSLNDDVLKQVQLMRLQVKAVVAELQEIKSFSAGVFSKLLDAEEK